MIISNSSRGQNIFGDSIINASQKFINNKVQINYELENISKRIGKSDFYTMPIKVKIRRNSNSKFQRKIIKVFNKVDSSYEFDCYLDSLSGFYYSIRKDFRTATLNKFTGKGGSVLGVNHSGIEFYGDSGLFHTYYSSISKSSFQGIVNYKKWNCYKFEIRTLDFPEIKNYKTLFYINVDDLMLVRITKNYEIFGEPVIEDFQLLDYDFKVDKEEEYFNQKAILEKYKIVSDSVENSKNIHENIQYTVDSFFAKNIKTQKVELIKFKKKITVLDFWFMGCYGCILSYPIIDSLKWKYSSNSNIEFIGLNDKDLEPKLIKNTQNYLTKHKITYDAYIVSKEITKTYQISSYPTFLIIVQDGSIQYRYEGYNQSLFKDLDNQIIHLLKTKL